MLLTLTAVLNFLLSLQLQQIQGELPGSSVSQVSAGGGQGEGCAGSGQCKHFLEDIKTAEF